MSGWGSIWQDLRYAVRSFHKDRGSVVLALLALALGIGATTVIFSVVYSVLIAGFPFKNPLRVVQFSIHDARDQGPGGRYWFTAPEFLDYRAQNHVFSTVMGGGSMDVLFTLDNSTYQVRGAILDPHTLPGLGVKPIWGREVNDSDGAPGAPGAPPTFLMSDRMWHDRFNRDPKVLGTTLTLNGIPRTLIGILPPRFRIENADVFFPTVVTADMTESVVGGPPSQPLYVWTFARLKAGVTEQQAEADLNVIAHNEAKVYPKLYPPQFNVTVRTFADIYLDKGLKEMIYILLGAVGMLLMIACGNVANLLLARSIARERELAVRATLGASRGRLARQLLAESFVLALAGAAIGCVFAYAGMTWVKTALPPTLLPAETTLEFSRQALLGTAAVTILTTVLCGLVPAFRASRRDLQNRLIASGKGVGAISGRGYLRTTLVALQMSLAIVLLLGAGLMMRTFFALQNVDLGIDQNNILTGRVIFPVHQYTEASKRNLFLREALRRIDTVPGVSAASASIALPIENALVVAVDIPGISHSDAWRSGIECVNEDYFRTVGLPLVSGKTFSSADVESSRLVVVVNRTFVHDFFHGSNPIGQNVIIQLAGSSADLIHSPAFQVVGVVPDAHNGGLEAKIWPEAFIPYTSAAGITPTTFLIRTSVDPLSVLHTVQQQIWNVDQEVAFTSPDSFENILHRDYFATPEFGLILLGIFASIGLILSAIGVFSVMAYTVSLQTHDIGVRMALGAEPRGVLKMMLWKGLRPILAGTGAGILAGYALTRLMANQIYGVKATDPWTFATAIVVLIAVGIAACFFPARRATKVDPLTALRYE